MDTEYWRSKGQRDILGSGRQHFKNLTCNDYLKVIINIYCICIIQEVKLYYMCFITVWNMFIPQLTFFSKDSRKRISVKRCGYFKLFNITVTGSKITMSFVSDEKYNAKGFYLTWKGIFRFLSVFNLSWLLTLHKNEIGVLVFYTMFKWFLCRYHFFVRIHRVQKSILLYTIHTLSTVYCLRPKNNIYQLFKDLHKF